MRDGELWTYVVYGVALIGIVCVNLVGAKELKNRIADLAIQLTDY